MDSTKIENSVLAIDVSVSFIHANLSQNEHEQALRKMHMNRAHEQTKSEHYEAKLCNIKVHNFVSLCSWNPETILNTCKKFVGTIKQNERKNKNKRSVNCVPASKFRRK